MANARVTHEVRIADYPELALICWNIHTDTVGEAEALAIYERNWRFVDEAAMTPRERALLERLVHEYGRGVLHV